MKKVLAKMMAILIIIVVSLQNFIVYASNEVQELEKEQNKINSQIESYEKKQKELEKQKSVAMKSVENLINQISASEAQINELESQINDLQDQIDAKIKDIQQKEEEYNEQEELLDTRLIAMYESGRTSYLEVLLTSASMTDFLAKYYAASELIEYDKELIYKTKEQKAQIENEKAELETSKAKLNETLSESEEKNNELKSLKKEKQNYANELTQEEKEIQKELEELEAENKAIEQKIKEAEKKYQQQLQQLQNNSTSNSAGKGFFIRPVSGGTISANGYYPTSGKFHGAVDYAVSSGTPVYAAADGVVLVTANLTNSYGTYVVIRHANGLQSYYAHGTRGSITVSPGQTVKQGQKIMLSGSTGNSSGPHLHFEVRKSPYNYKSNATAYGQDSRVNPYNYM